MKLYITIVFLTCSLTVWSQITAPGASATRYTDYSSTGSNDPVFIFCSSDGHSDATLRAVSPLDNGPFDFSWYAWDEAASAFSTSLGQETGVMSSQLEGLPEGGYRVEISNGAGLDTAFNAWIHLDSPVSVAGLNDYKCNYVALSGHAAIDTFLYSDINSGEQIMLPNDYRFIWSSDPPSSIPKPERYLNPQTFDPPLDDVWYNLHVVDSFGCSADSSFFYESIHVEADFEADPVQGEAPLEVFLSDKSTRASSYTWDFGDDSASYLAEPASYIYYIPGSYKLRLFIESDMFCRDSTSVNITVEPSSLDIPNVFTPDGNGKNDFFYVVNKSLRSIYVQIFSKSGQRVYVFDGRGNALKDWQGWDGKIGSNDASPGIYFYVIRASGWDDVLYEGEEYRGFVYLYR